MLYKLKPNKNDSSEVALSPQSISSRERKQYYQAETNGGFRNVNIKFDVFSKIEYNN